MNLQQRCLLTDLQKSDEGSYLCIAENQFGRDEASASVLITGIVSPVIAFISPLYELKSGESLRLDCTVIVGNPRPHIR